MLQLRQVGFQRALLELGSEICRPQPQFPLPDAKERACYKFRVLGGSNNAENIAVGGMREDESVLAVENWCRLFVDLARRGKETKGDVVLDGICHRIREVELGGESISVDLVP